MATARHATHDRSAAGSRIHDPEVLPPEDEPGRKGNATDGGRTSRRMGQAGGLSFLLAGVLLDAMDVLTAGPVGVMTGSVIGGSLAFLVAGLLGLSSRKRLLMTVAAAVYCSLPMTELIPMGTLLGTFFGLRQTLRTESPTPTDSPGS